MKKYLKPTIIFLVILFARLLPVRPPNVEPILGSVLPLSKRYGALLAGVFAFMSILVYDALTAGIGSHTWVPALTYALIGILGSAYIRGKKGTRTNYALTSIFGILVFDIITGVIAIPLSGDTTWALAFMGQIPFTALHLMGGVLFAITLSPALEKYFATDFSFGKLFGIKSLIVKNNFFEKI